MTSTEHARDSQELLNSGIQHHVAGRLPEAAALYERVLHVQPANADAIHLLGVIAHQRGEHARAVETIERAIALNASHPAYFSNLGEAYRALGQAAEAESSYRRALALNPANADAHHNLATLFMNTGRLHEAGAEYESALELNPGSARVRLNHAFLKLLQGDYKTGFEQFESRFEGGNATEIGAARALLGTLDIPRWTGAPLNGEALLIWTEQGLGDSLMMMRYLPQLESRGAGQVAVYADAQLVRIMLSTEGVDEVVSQDLPLPSDLQCRSHCPLMSLPLVFDTRIETIPREIPYVHVPRVLQTRWAALLKHVGRPRIGLTWAGGKVTGSDARRSIALEQFAPLFELAGVNFVSLQKGEEARQLRNAGLRMLDWMDECTDLLDTAALIQQLDLVVTVDTSVAHLAGALGKPVWLLNRHESEWRWMLGREDSPWYPTMRIFRQSRRGQWDDVLERVASAIRLQQASASTARNDESSERGQQRSLWSRLLSRIRT